MKRILFAIAVLILLSACAVQQPAAPSAPAVPSEPEEPSVMEQETYVPEEPETIEEMMPEERTRLAAHQSPDLVKAFEQGMQKCSYLKDGVMITAWVLSEDRFRLESAIPGTRISTIYDMQVIHSWDDRTKLGVKININDLPDHADERVAGISVPASPEEMRSGVERVICVASTAIGEDILDVPDNVVFTSVGTLMEGIEEN